MPLNYIKLKNSHALSQYVFKSRYYSAKKHNLGVADNVLQHTLIYINQKAQFNRFVN